MGWDGLHLHEFRFGKQLYGPHNPQGSPFEIESQIDEREARINQVLLRVGSKGIFTYDFGDNWEHGIVLEKRLPVDPDVNYPLCTGGERACPPEDIGGVYGFTI
jgi:Plasmid pRiA4b ORF-3-like protein